MTAPVTDTTPVVKLDAGHARGQNAAMARLDRILARIQAVLDRGTFPSARAWCRAAGVSDTYIGTLKTRGGKDGTGEVTGVKEQHLAALAKAAGVSMDWLSGDSERPKTLHAAPPVSGLDLALQLFDWPPTLPAKLAGEVVQRARAEAGESEVSLGDGFWLRRLSGIMDEVTGKTPASSKVQPVKEGRK